MFDSYSDAWALAQTFLLLVAFLTPLTYQLLNHLTDRMMGIDEKSILSLFVEKTVSKHLWRVKGYYILIDFLVSEITLNTLFLLLMTIPMRLTDIDSLASAGLIKNYTALDYREGVIAPILWCNLFPIFRQLFLSAFFVIKVAFHLTPLLSINGVRRNNLRAFFVGATDNTLRYYLSIFLLFTIFGSPLALIIYDNQLPPGLIILLLVLFIFSWVVLATAWTPVSSLHIIQDYQNKLSDLGRQQYISFENNAKNYEEDDAHRYTNIQKVIGLLTGLDVNPLLRVFYAGCGPGRLLVDLASQLQTKGKEFQIIAMDFSPSMLEEARNKLKCQCFVKHGEVILVNEDFQNAGYLPSERFNAILCLNNTLGNLIDKDIASALHSRNKALSMFNRFLKPGGVLILTVYGPERENQKDEKYYTKRLKYIHDLSSPGTNDWVMELDISKDKPGVNKSYLYTHWFTEYELKDILSSHGFVKINVNFPQKDVLMAIGYKPKGIRRKHKGQFSKEKNPRRKVLERSRHNYKSS